MSRDELICKGCDRIVVVEPGPDGKMAVWHPEPLCARVLELLASGVAAGPVLPATLDRDTGEIVETPFGGDN